MRNVPKLRFKEFTDEWEEKRLGEISNFLDGKRKPIKDSDRNNKKGIYPYYGASGIIDYIDDYIFDKELILLGEDGANILTRSTRLAFLATGKYWVNNHAHVIEGKENINQYFLCEYLEKLDYTQYNTGTAQPKLNQEVCKNILIKVSTFCEQQKIANFLSSVDKKISIVEEKLNLFNEYKKGIMQKIFNQELRFKDENENDYPEWEEKKLGEITSYVDYRGKTPEKTENGVFLVTAKNIKMGYIDYTASQEFVSSENYDEIMKRGKPKIGDVLLTTEAPLGNVAQIDKEDIALAQRVIKFRGKEDLINNTFLKYAFLSDDFQNKLKNKAIGTTVLGIQGKVLHKLSLNFPASLIEQQKIADFLSAIDTKIEKISDELENLKEFKKGLLQQMFV